MHVIWTEKAGILAAAFLLDAMLGDPRSSLHPVCLIGSLISFLEKGLRAVLPDTERGQLTAGFFLALLCSLICTALTVIILLAAGRISHILSLLLETILCYFFLAARSLQKESMAVCRRLEEGDVEGARTAVSMIVGRDTGRLDAAGITKAAVETVAENSSDGVIAPLIFMAVGGAAGGALYKAINTMDSMVGYRNEKYLYLGRAAARLDDAANFLPSRITALLMIMAAFILGTTDDHFQAGRALRIFLRDRKKHASPNSAQPESAAAGALGLQLAGDAWYFGTLHHKPFIGDGLRQIEPADIRRVCRLMYTAAILCLLLISLFCLLAGRLV